MRTVRYIPAALAVAGLLAFVSIGRADSATPKGAQGTATISGKVVDMAGKPAAKARVTLYAGIKPDTAAVPAPNAPEKGKQKHEKQKMIAQTVTDDDGIFKFEKVEAGDYVVMVREKGLGMATTPITVKDGETQDVQLTLSKKTK